MCIRDRKAIGETIMKDIHSRGLSVEDYASTFGFSVSSMYKMTSGRNLTERALAKLQAKTGQDFRRSDTKANKAADDLGAYRLEDYAHYQGNYSYIRPAFDTSEIYLFPVTIDWDGSRPGLRIESMLNGIKKVAYLSFPDGSPHFFIQANENGWMSLAIFGRADVSVLFKGGLLTMGQLEGGIYAPYFLPIILRREDRAGRARKTIDQSSSDYLSTRRQLDSIIRQRIIRAPHYEE